MVKETCYIIKLGCVATFKRGLFNKFQSSKIVLFPSGLEHDNASQGFHGEGCGFLMVGNRSAASVRVIESTMASSSSDMGALLHWSKIAR